METLILNRLAKFLLEIVYATLCFIPIILLANFIGIGNSWWVILIFTGVSLFIGSFLYTQFHGTQVMELKHLGSNRVDHTFQVIIRAGKQTGYFNVIGRYMRTEPFSDLVLQTKLFTALNKFPGSKWIRDFAQDTTAKTLNVHVDDLESIIRTTIVEIEKIDIPTFQQPELDQKTKAEIEKQIDGMSHDEIGMRLWEEEQKLLAEARKKGLEKELIAYWESVGRPRMTEPPTKTLTIEEKARLYGKQKKKKK